MKKQILLVAAVAALGVSASAMAADGPFDATTGNMASTDARSQTITGSTARYIADDYSFNLSTGVAFAFLQDPEAVAAVASTARGSLQVFGGSSDGGTVKCGGDAGGTNAVPTVTTPASVTDGCTGHS